jgi:hypothetical protein
MIFFLLQAVPPVMEVMKTQYTAAEILLFIAAIGAIITTSIQSWRQGGNIQSIKETSKVIEGHVNSQTTEYKQKIQALQDAAVILNTTITELKETAKLLALSVASHPAQLQQVEVKQPVDVNVVPKKE